MTQREQTKHTDGGSFHIHIDAQKRMPADLHRLAVEELGFCDTNFNGHPEGFVHFEPTQHLTLKLPAKAKFDSAWRRLESAIERPDFVGYVEGEYLVSDESIEYHPYRDLDVPFQVERGRLTGAAGEQFRQTELHLTLRREGSDPRLAEKLLHAGLYGAYMPKADGDYLVLTVQGFVKDIGPLQRALQKFVENAGGAQQCTLKEERAIKHKLVGMKSPDLPEIARRVTYR